MNVAIAFIVAVLSGFLMGPELFGNVSAMAMFAVLVYFVMLHILCSQDRRKRDARSGG